MIHKAHSLHSRMLTRGKHAEYQPGRRPRRPLFFIFPSRVFLTRALTQSSSCSDSTRPSRGCLPWLPASPTVLSMCTTPMMALTTRPCQAPLCSRSYALRTPIPASGQPFWSETGDLRYCFWIRAQRCPCRAHSCKGALATRTHALVSRLVPAAGSQRVVPHIHSTSNST